MRYFFDKEWSSMFGGSQPHVLHFAPEAYLIDFLNTRTERYVKGDFFAPGYHYTSDTLHMDVQQIPFESNTWDMVIANHVLEHVQNDEQALNEIFRVLKPGGIAIIQVPLSLYLSETIEVSDVREDSNYEEITGQFDHKRLYGLDFLNRLKRSNFEIEFWSDRNNVSWLGLHPEERIVIARKIAEV
jgi:SAM-dependent methyltransferase